MDPSTPRFSRSSILHRQNSIPTPPVVIIPSKLPLPPHATPPAVPSPSLMDLELTSLKPSPFISYTSLKDLLPGAAAANSPTAAEIAIRNRLVKQAASKYLQPAILANSTGSSPGEHFLRRIWLRFSSCLRCLTFCLDRIIQWARIPMAARD